MEAWCRAELPQWAADDVAALRLGGEELAVLTLRSMVLLLSGAADPAAAGRELLARRDAMLEERRQSAAPGDKGGGAECAICLEEYDGQERFQAGIRR